MSILIEGMEMPTEEEISKCIIVRHDGEVWIVEFDDLIDGGYVCCYPTNPMRAVPVPPHGDLIDKKTVSENLASVLNKKNPPFSYPDWNDAIVAMLTAPTIIPAEEGET